ncbi:MAG: hypothetical protein JSV86_04895 [Gemmatimonadota bacterium]|nr:MAG: hypothetical protein JSV86_04895 [Gemmatimonadota bacterium]
MAAHLRGHPINDTDNHEPGTNDTVLGTEAGAISEVAFSVTAAASALVRRGAAGQITLPSADPVAATDAASKGYVDAKVTEGVTWKELVLAPEQFLNGGSGAILQAILGAIAINPSNGDTFVITDGTTTETFTFVTTETSPFEVQIGIDAPATTTNLVQAINDDSTLWSAVETTGLDAYFTGANDPQFVVYRTAYSAAADRVYGTLTATTGIQIVEFATGVQDYRESSGTQSDLPGSDPAAKRFGFGRDFATLQQGDTHRVADDNTAYTWDADDQVWQQTSGGTAITAGDGIDITGQKVSTKVATTAGAATQQFGGLVNNRTSDGTGAAAADQGYNAVKTDNSTIAVDQATNALTIVQPGLPEFQGFGSWTSSNAADREPTLAEYQALLGTTGADIGNWGFLVESGGGGRTTTFLAYKKANAGALSDYQAVALEF